MERFYTGIQTEKTTGQGAHPAHEDAEGELLYVYNYIKFNLDVIKIKTEVATPFRIGNYIWQ